jgi:hypothetical protein
MMHARAGFFANQKSRAELYALGSQSESCHYSASVSDTSGGNHGH